MATGLKFITVNYKLGHRRRGGDLNVLYVCNCAVGGYLLGSVIDEVMPHFGITGDFYHYEAVEGVAGLQRYIASDRPWFHRPALIVIDICLPDVKDAVAICRSRWADTPVIISSAWDLSWNHGQHIREVHALRVNGLYEQPFSFAEFVSMYDEIVGRVLPGLVPASEVETIEWADNPVPPARTKRARAVESIEAVGRGRRAA
jgi:hypothetical protein